MILVGITLLLSAAIAINHIVHGAGCWGQQPGGSMSAGIYDLQILTAVVGFLWLHLALLQKTVRYTVWRIFVIEVFMALSVWLFMQFGWTAHTSIHNLGPENLMAYLMMAATTYFIGRYMHQHRQPEFGKDRKPSKDGRDAVQNNRPPSDNPYEPPQIII